MTTTVRIGGEVADPGTFQDAGNMLGTAADGDVAAAQDVYPPAVLAFAVSAGDVPEGADLVSVSVVGRSTAALLQVFEAGWSHSVPGPGMADFSVPIGLTLEQLLGGVSVLVGNGGTPSVDYVCLEAEFDVPEEEPEEEPGGTGDELVDQILAAGRVDNWLVGAEDAPVGTADERLAWAQGWAAAIRAARDAADRSGPGGPAREVAPPYSPPPAIADPRRALRPGERRS